MSDCPDYTHAVVLTSASNPIVDCPDWQEQVVAPGGGAVIAGPGYYFGGIAASTYLTTAGVTLLTTDSLALGTYLFVLSIFLDYSATDTVNVTVIHGTGGFAAGAEPGLVCNPGAGFVGSLTVCSALVATVSTAGTFVVKGHTASGSTNVFTGGFTATSNNLTVIGPLGVSI